MRKSTMIMILCCLLPPTVLGLCSNKQAADDGPDSPQQPTTEEVAAAPIDTPIDSTIAAPTAPRDFMPDTVGAYAERLPMMDSTEIAQPIHVNYLGKNYAAVFADKNDVQMPHAQEMGIERITSIRSHWQNTRGMERVVSCKDFYIDNLTHSRPILVPEAKAMLHEIGRRFCDSLQARGGGNYRIKVTSLTRTDSDVRRLRRVNINSVGESTHFYGTTVDISHADFARDPGGEPRTVDNLKGILSEVLYAMRQEGKCCVLYERKQQCFHVTVCGPETKKRQHESQEDS